MNLCILALNLQRRLYYRAGVPLIPEIHKNPDQQWQKKY
jgi:hypothetical protein